MAADHALRRELSRRIRDDLIRLGIVAAGPAVRIADGATASAGDLIICTKNDHTVEAGEPGRTLANGDLLRIEQVTPAGLIVRRALDADPATGQRRWTDRTFLYQHFAMPSWATRSPTTLPKAAPCTAGLAVITGTEDRQHAYVALSRGTGTNMAYVFTVSPKLADPMPGPRPAPELARYDRITAERAVQPAAAAAETRDALAVLAGVLDRDGQQLSASQTRQQALADADHLAILHAIWTDQTTPAREQHYRDLLAAHLPPEHRRRARPPGPMAVADPARRRTGRPGPQRGPGRCDRRTGPGRGPRPGRCHRRPHPVPARRPRPSPGGPVVGPGPRHRRPRTPRLPDRDRRADGRPQGPHRRARRPSTPCPGRSPPWARCPTTRRTGPDWQRRAASIGAWRELSGHRDPADPIGPEPVAAAPDLRAAWHEALAALGPADGPDVRGMPDGQLLHLRDTYPIETAWAPQYVGDELRQVRAAASEARLVGLRAAAEATAAKSRGDHATAARQQELAASYHALHEAYRQRETVFAATMVDRADWEAATRAQRHLAVAADAELRRRHPDQHHPPLRSAEPDPATDSQRSELTLSPEQPPGEMSRWITDLTVAHRTFAERLADRQSMTIPAEDPTYGDLGQAFPLWPGPGRDAILQPPKPEIRPSPYVLERAADRDADREAGD